MTGPAGSIRQRLRAETRDAHLQIERALDLMRPDFTRDDYIALLMRHHGFHQPFERHLGRLARAGNAIAHFYCGSRRKAAWLEADLFALGVSRVDEGRQVAEARISRLYPGNARLLGAIYVIEGSMLGGAVLSCYFGTKLGLSSEHGLRFFSGNGQAAGARWSETLRLLEQGHTSESERDDIVAGALDTFHLLKMQLTGDTQAPDSA